MSFGDATVLKHARCTNRVIVFERGVNTNNVFDKHQKGQSSLEELKDILDSSWCW